MGTYNLPRNVKGEGRILFIFTPKSLLGAIIGVALGLVFYFIFSMINLNIVGIVIVALFALIGFAITTFKVPNIGISKTTKLIAGESIDEIIRRAFKFKRKGNKLYVYDNKEVRTNDK